MLIKMRQKNQHDYIASFTTVSQRHYVFTENSRNLHCPTLDDHKGARPALLAVHSFTPLSFVE